MGKIDQNVSVDCAAPVRWRLGSTIRGSRFQTPQAGSRTHLSRFGRSDACSRKREMLPSDWPLRSAFEWTTRRNWRPKGAPNARASSRLGLPPYAGTVSHSRRSEIHLVRPFEIGALRFNNDETTIGYAVEGSTDGASSFGGGFVIPQRHPAKRIPAVTQLKGSSWLDCSFSHCHF